ncbi:type 1 glutamine amidotransferase [Desulfolithobacter sp.]
MDIHILQHVPFEGPGHILSWAEKNGHRVTCSRLFDNPALPAPETVDRLVVMGGPMNIYEHDRFPWLQAEKEFLANVIEGGGRVLGICLGAQLIADVLGARVHPGAHKEIGWFPVFLTPEARETRIFGFLEPELTVFHWHGDTFAIPEGSVHLARSEACQNQAFLYDDRVLGLQFHLESTPESVELITRHCQDELIPGIWIQNRSEIKEVPRELFQAINMAMEGILDRLFG